MRTTNATLYLVGWFCLTGALGGAYVYTDSLKHGFRISPTLVMWVALSGMFGVVAMVLGFIRDVVTGYRCNWSNGNKVPRSSTSRATIPIEHTEQERTLFREQFAARRKRQRIATAPAIVFLVALRFFDKNTDRSNLVLAGGAVLILFVAYLVGVGIFSLRNWRCPACDRYLSSSINPTCCPKCGVELK
jgi:hypothetical protein